MVAYTDALVSFDTVDYARHRTAIFVWRDSVQIELKPLLEERLGFLEPPVLSRHRYINPSLRNATFLRPERADLIVSDSPTEIYGLLPTETVKVWFKLPDLQSNAESAGIAFEGWPGFERLTVGEKSRVLATSLMRKCQKEGTSEEALLGCRILTWDAFAQEFSAVVDDARRQVLAFPRTRVVAYHTFHGGTVSRANVKNAIPGAQLTYGTMREGKEHVWICRDCTPFNMFSHLSQPQFNIVIPADDYTRISEELERSFGATLRLVPAPALLDMSGTPSLMTRLQYRYYLSEKTFTVEELREIARKLKLRGHSDKTKAELSIMIAEALAAQGTAHTQPALLWESTGLGMPSDVAMDQAGSWFANQQYDAEDYFKFAMRVVAHVAYAPNLPPLPGGRVPTDGFFPSFYAIEPLNIFA